MKINNCRHRPGDLRQKQTYQFAGTEMVYRFNTHKVLHQDEQQLQQSNNPFAMAILTVLLALKKNKLDDDSLLQLKSSLVKQLYAKGFARQTIRHLLDFITVYVNPAFIGRQVCQAGNGC